MVGHTPLEGRIGVRIPGRQHKNLLFKKIKNYYVIIEKVAKLLFKIRNKIMKKGYFDNIEKSTLENDNFRKVLYTGKHCQLVLMSLLPNEDIGEEIHNENDQFFRFEDGEGKVIIDETEYTVGDGDVIIVPSGAKHNIIAGEKGLKLYTIYSPAHHKEGTIRKTKKEAIEDEPEFDGITTE